MMTRQTIWGIYIDPATTMGNLNRPGKYCDEVLWAQFAPDWECQRQCFNRGACWVPQAGESSQVKGE
jgi:hypothetical protein